MNNPPTAAESEAFVAGKLAGRVDGIRDTATLLRAAANKEHVTKIFIPGQQPKTCRSINRALLNNCAGIMDRMAGDLLEGRIRVGPDNQLQMLAEPHVRAPGPKP